MLNNRFLTSTSFILWFSYPRPLRFGLNKLLQVCQNIQAVRFWHKTWKFEIVSSQNFAFLWFEVLEQIILFCECFIDVGNVIGDLFSIDEVNIIFFPWCIDPPKESIMAAVILCKKILLLILKIIPHNIRFLPFNKHSILLHHILTFLLIIPSFLTIFHFLFLYLIYDNIRVTFRTTCYFLIAWREITCAGVLPALLEAIFLLMNVKNVLKFDEIVFLFELFFGRAAVVGSNSVVIWMD